MNTNEEAESQGLLEFCNDPDNPICVIRGLAEAVGLGKFLLCFLECNIVYVRMYVCVQI